MRETQFSDDGVPGANAASRRRAEAQHHALQLRHLRLSGALQLRARVLDISANASHSGRNYGMVGAGFLSLVNVHANPMLDRYQSEFFGQIPANYTWNEHTRVVSVHVRRGDFIKSANKGVLSPEYYAESWALLLCGIEF